MSPKSRGRPAGRGRAKRPRQPVRQLRLSDRVMSAARELADVEEVLAAEVWASKWLGRAWAAAGLGERDPEQLLCTEVVDRACSRPSPHGRAAVAALRSVAPVSARAMLDETLQILTDQPASPWETAAQWQPLSAARAVSVWGDEQVLFVEYDGPRPHALLVVIHQVGGTVINRLEVLEPGAAAAFEQMRDEPGEVAMPVSDAVLDEVLAEVADALRQTDMYWPRHDDENYVDLRALAWSRSRDHLSDGREWLPVTDEARAELIEAFVAAGDLADDSVTRSLADLFIDYGDGYISAGPLGWSPGWVAVFLTDYLPRKVALDPEQRSMLPEVLRAWVRFTGDQRGIDAQWIAPMVEAVDECLPDFEAAFDDTDAWGPAKQIAAQLADRGIDLTDHDAVNDAIHALNAESLARRILET